VFCAEDLTLTFTCSIPKALSCKYHCLEYGIVSTYFNLLESSKNHIHHMLVFAENVQFSQIDTLKGDKFLGLTKKLDLHEVYSAGANYTSDWIHRNYSLIIYLSEAPWSFDVMLRVIPLEFVYCHEL
jgi:hypothetical protein